jgi:hypothetical protein
MSAQSVQQARDEVFRKIGRNVVNFQKLEGMLKVLLKSSGFHGKASEIEAQVKDRNKSIEMQSMGKLVGSLFDSVLTNSSGEELPEDIDEPWISARFVIELEETEADNLKHALAEIVEERNKLIHQLLLSSVFNSIESCNELSAQLDSQREKLKPQFKRLHSFLQSKMKLHAQIAEFSASEEFKSLLSE